MMPRCFLRHSMCCWKTSELPTSVSCRSMVHNADSCGDAPLKYGSRSPVERDPRMSFLVWLSQLSWPNWLRVTAFVVLARQRRAPG
jgi:hypothetical protein